MISRSSCMALVATMVLAASGALAEDEGFHNHGWYAGLGAGISLVPNPIDSSGTSTSLIGGTTYNYYDVLSTNPGFALDGAFGYKLRSGWRFDLEVSYRRNSLDRFDEFATGSLFGGSGGIRSTPLDGSLSSVAYMIDVWYELQIADRWMPYLGLGIGAVTTLADVPPVAFIPVLDTHTDFGFQLGFGLGYAIDEKTVVTVDYRYVESLDVEAFFLIFGADYVDYRAHNLMLGIRRHFSFGG